MFGKAVIPKSEPQCKDTPSVTPVADHTLTRQKRNNPMPTKVQPLDITVLAGGPGAEREVSLESGSAVSNALRRLGHRVSLSDISVDDLSALDRRADIIFIALHGEFGEDGTVQRELDERGVPYCGSGADASRIAFDKVESKRRFEQIGMPTPEYVVTGSSKIEGAVNDNAVNIDDAARKLKPPVFIKPRASGSSVDTHRASTNEELRRYTAKLLEKYGQALIERAITGPELTVGILGIEALPVCQIRTQDGFYDYKAKYLDDRTEYLFDIDLPDSLLKHVQVLSLQAHQCLGCAVFSRVDWMVDAATLEPFILEVNTIPGFTSHSLLPKAAQMAGIRFDELCQRIIELSLEAWKK